MAGEKLSPRQKMIGMMYLVLTALLALQVSGSVLEKFILINKSLENSVSLGIRENAKRVEHIKTIVRESGNRAADVEVLEVVLEARKKTQHIVEHIDTLKSKLIAMTGGRNKKTGFPKGIKDDSAVARLMINEGKGHELQKLLNGHMHYLSQVAKKSYAPIALDAKDSDLYKNDPNQHKKNFTCLNFDHTPLGAALATLTQLAAETVYVETNALEELSRSIGADDVKFDNLVPVVKPQSTIVAAGARYRAELFLAASSSGTSPQMTVDDRAIAVDNGIGRVDFLATPGNYDKEGLAKKTFRAAIKLPVPGGQDTTYVEDITYFVAKPVIQVQSAAVQALYLNCGNDLNVQVPALGAEYNPRFEAKGASVIAGQGKGLVTIVPQESEVKLNVYNNNSLLGNQIFKVRTIPKPDISITSRGNPINEKQGMPAPGPRSLEVRAVADESFKSLLPKDARYKVKQWEVTLARGSNAVKIKKVSDQEANISELAAMARAGDRLVIEIKRVERLNFKGEIEVVKMGSIIRTIPLT